MEQEKIYQIALSKIPRIGPKKARNLVSYLGGVEAVFTEKKQDLLKIPGIGRVLASFDKDKVLKEAERELDYCRKNNIRILFYAEKDYPGKLKNFDDMPVVLYVKGNYNFDNRKKIAIIGTRRASLAGNSLCVQFIKDVENEGFKPVIISGLAYGIDACAHKEALNNDLPTIAVLGHGLNTVYPASHRALAEQITQNGLLLTEFTAFSRIDATNFARRNRIVAALSDAVIVVEAPAKSGTLITAEYAVGYNIDIFAFPGRPSDKNFAGCNYLIKTTRAALIENAADFVYSSGWTKAKKVQKTIFQVELTDDERKILEAFEDDTSVNVDVVAYRTKIPIGKVLSTLFNLEFKGVVKSLPGRMYEKI